MDAVIRCGQLNTLTSNQEVVGLNPAGGTRNLFNRIPLALISGLCRGSSFNCYFSRLQITFFSVKPHPLRSYKVAWLGTFFIFI